MLEILRIGVTGALTGAESVSGNGSVSLVTLGEAVVASAAFWSLVMGGKQLGGSHDLISSP